MPQIIFHPLAQQELAHATNYYQIRARASIFTWHLGAVQLCLLIVLV